MLYLACVACWPAYRYLATAYTFLALSSTGARGARVARSSRDVTPTYAFGNLTPGSARDAFFAVMPA